MNLGLNTVSSTYQFVLNQSGANAITLGDNSAVNWNAGGVVALTGTQTISGSKTFDSPITSKGDIYVTATDSTEGGQISLLGNANTIYLDNYLGHARIIAGSKELVRFKSDGKVGIGTSSPDAKLHLKGSNNSWIDGILLEQVATPQKYSISSREGGKFSISDETTLLERFVILNNGNIGIGTSSPSSKLAIQRASGSDVFGEIYNSDGTYWTRFNSNSTAGSYNSLVQAGDHSIIYSNGTIDTGGLTLGQWSNSARGIRIDTNGYVGIGTGSPSHILHITSQGRSTSSSWAITSDERVKTKINKLNNSLYKIEKLNPVSFEYSNEYCKINQEYSGIKYGFIAQEVEKIFPTCVETISEKIGDKEYDDFKILNTSDIFPNMVSAIQELKQIIDSQNLRISELESKLL